MRFPYQMMKRLSPARNTRQTPLQNEAGYSFLELLIVLFCVSVLIGIALPGYRNVVDYRNLKATANHLYADLKECQSLAVLTGINHSVRLTGESGYEVWKGNTRSKSVTFPADIRLSEQNLSLNRAIIEFNDRGHPIGAGTVVLSDRHNHQIRLTIHLHSGQIEVKEERD